MRVDDCSLRSLEFLLQPLDLFKQFLVVSFLGLHVLLGVGGDHGGALCETQSGEGFFVVGISWGNGSDHEGSAVSCQ